MGLIEKNKAQVATLRSELQHDEKVRDKLIEETNPLFEKAIKNLGKSNEEESKRDA